MSIETAFIQSAVKRLHYYKELADKTFAQLNQDELHYQPNESSNSIAIIIQHMAGNMLSRWTGFLTSDGEKDWRNRDTEFEEQHMNREQLMAFWEKGWACCLDAIGSLQDEDLSKTIYIRGEGLIVVDAINRQLAHYPYHVGQIVYLGRMIRNHDWQNLSILKGQSDHFNKEMREKK